MRSLFVLLLALGVGQAFADDCTDLAKRFADNKDSLKVGKLDDLKSCISDLEQSKVQAPTATTSGGAPTVSQLALSPVSQPVNP